MQLVINALSVFVFFCTIAVMFCAEITRNAVDENSVLKIRRKLLDLRVKEIVISQLGVSKVKDLSQYEIEGWPKFVSLHSRGWDEQAIKDLDSSLPSLVFKEKQPDSINKRKFVATSRKELLVMLLDWFRGQTGIHNCHHVYWSDFHVRGWPVDVTLRFEYWRAKDILAVYHGLNAITWERIREGEGRTVTYTDGTIQSWDEAVKRKRKRMRKNRSLMTSCDDAFKDFNGSDQDEIMQDDACFEFHENNLMVVDCTRSAVEIPKKSGNKHLKSCIEMYSRVTAIARQQLNRVLVSDLEDYEIENWPRFLSLNYKLWDEEALLALEAALPSLRFKDKQQTDKRGRIVNALKSELNALLLERFKELIGPAQKNSNRIPWSQYHVTGWPSGVSLYNGRWRAADMFRIHRNLENIQWRPVERGELPTVIYTDGTAGSTAVENRKTKRLRNVNNAAENELNDLGFGSVRDVSQDYYGDDFMELFF